MFINQILPGWLLVWLVGSFFVFFSFFEKHQMGSWLSHPPLPSHHMLWISITVKLTHLLLEKMIKISNFDVILTIN